MGDRRTLLVVGAATRDLDPTDPRGWRLGGTVTYASLAAARLGVQVRALVGADVEAASASELDVLRDAGVETRLVALERGPVFDNQQSPAGRVQIAHQASDRIVATSLPPEWADTATVLLGPVADELGGDWASALRPHTFVALTWQGLLRRLKPGQPVEMVPLSRTPLVARASALLLSAEDSAGDAPPVTDLLGAGQFLMLTHGSRGAIAIGMLAGDLRARWVPAIPPVTTVDTTGAGDVFAGAWLASRLLAPDASLDKHLLVASAMAGLSVSVRSLAEMPSRTDLCRVLVRKPAEPNA